MGTRGSEFWCSVTWSVTMSKKGMEDVTINDNLRIEKIDM